MHELIMTAQSKAPILYMKDLKEGQIAKIISSGLYVVKFEDKCIILNKNKTNNGPGFDYYIIYADDKTEVRFLPLGEKITVQFYNIPENKD